MKYTDTWDLDTIFPGGTKSPELQTKLHTIKAEITRISTSHSGMELC